MKKQFNRMKQLANQTVGRAERTEVLSDDLLHIERRMELVRLLSHNTHKRLVSVLQGQLGVDNDKRQRKLPLTALSQAMQEGGAQLKDESLIGQMMDVCGETESLLATELMQHEVQIERDVLEPLNHLAEVEIPNILKQRKQLAKLVLDYDSAKTRWYQAMKSGNATMASKVDALKDEMDEALNKVELCKDQLSADMYSFASKEGEYARQYVLLLESQAEYHRRSLAVLEAALPNIRTQQDSWAETPAFGTLLEEHLKKTNREIALPIEACVMMLLETGMKEEGLFRIAAGASKLKKLKAALDCSSSQLDEFYSDPHAVAGALKSYLRELPEPLMTFDLYDEWTQAASVCDPDKRLQALWVTCDQMPKTHKANFRYLVKFLSKLSQDSEVNKMSPSNISIVLGPNLLWARTDGSLAEMAAATSVHVVAIIEPFIQHADWFFPEDIDFNVSGMFSSPSHSPSPDADQGLDSRRVEGDSPASRKDSPVTMAPDPAPRRSNAANRIQLPSPTQQAPPPQTGVISPPSSPDSGPGFDPSPSIGPGAQVRRPLVSRPNSLEGGSPARDPPSSSSPPPPQRNGSFLGVPQGGSRGSSPHMIRRGTKKQAPPPPKQATPFSSPLPTGSAHHQPLATPRRNPSKDSLIQSPTHPPQASPTAGEAEPSLPDTPTPTDTPPLDSTHSAALSPHPPGFLARPARPAPKPRPRPSMPPPPQPTANESPASILSSASKIITEGGLVFKGVSRALIPDVVPQPSSSSSSSSSSSLYPDLQWGSENTPL